jgi:hypothetical protein
MTAWGARGPGFKSQRPDYSLGLLIGNPFYIGGSFPIYHFHNFVCNSFTDIVEAMEKMNKKDTFFLVVETMYAITCCELFHPFWDSKRLAV